ncbi:MAG: type II toxin-antitoxin system Phd/YefM family antitoxin [Bryobacteraceae bacterium]
MAVVNIHQAKTNLSKLIQRSLEGEEIIVAKAGEPLVRIVAYRQKRRDRNGGQWRGQLWMSEDFDRLPEDLGAAFRGESE